jgi:hypothetical protein
MKQIGQTTYHKVNPNKFDVDQIRVTYCKESKLYHIEQVDRLGRLTNQRGYYYCHTHSDMVKLVNLLTDYLNNVGLYPFQLSAVN